MPGRRRGASVVPVQEDGTPVIPVVPLVPVTEITPSHELTEEQARPFNPIETVSPTGYVPNFRVNDDGNAEPLPPTEPAKPDFINALYQRVADITDNPNDDAGLAALAEIVVCLDRLTEVVGVVAQQQQWVTTTIQQMKGEFDQLMGAGNPLQMMGNMLFGGKKKG